MSDLKQAESWPDNKVLPDGDVVVRINGRLFRCQCGCNVFRHPEGEPDIYRCNSCQTEYESE